MLPVRLIFYSCLVWEGLESPILVSEEGLSVRRVRNVVPRFMFRVAQYLDHI